MLCLTCRPDDRKTEIVCGSDLLKIRIRKVRGTYVTLGLEAPTGLAIMRRAASSSSDRNWEPISRRALALLCCLDSGLLPIPTLDNFVEEINELRDMGYLDVGSISESGLSFLDSIHKLTLRKV